MTPGAASIGRISEPTRFYLLGELAPAERPAQTWSAPLNLAVMIDRSSSMRGPRIFEAKRAVKSLLSQMRADDRLTLLAFDDRPDLLVKGSSPAGDIGAQMALDAVSPRGATQLAPALELALHYLEADIASGRVAGLLLLTDGRTYGDEERCGELAEWARLLGVPIASFGLGLDWNRPLLDQLAAMSGGSCAFVEDPARLTELVDAEFQRLRATLAANVRLELEPAAGVSVLRASTVAPDLADVFDGPHAPGEATQVKFGALTSQPQFESVVALWELLLDPLLLSEDASGQIDLGTVTADWSPAHASADSSARASQRALVHRSSGSGDGVGPMAPDARLALELLTAYRLHAQADALATAGAPDEAAAALTTSALRLRSAGDERSAREAQQAASSLLVALDDGLTATLRAKYAMRNVGMFHRLRRAMRSRLAVNVETPRDAV
ncbi:MAG TPA: VWA domain-containing protein [Ktedonobacterales bacterium]